MLLSGILEREFVNGKFFPEVTERYPLVEGMQGICGIYTIASQLDGDAGAGVEIRFPHGVQGIGIPVRSGSFCS